MPTAVTEFPIKSYQQQNHLLIQFILFDLISVHRSLIDLKENIEEKNARPIETLLYTLAGSGYPYGYQLLWHEDALLARLTNHCDLFLHQEKNAILLSMQKEINNAWSITIAMSNSPLERLPIYLEKLNRSIKRFARFTFKAVQELHDDENVLFFLLRHQDDLDQIYGQGYIKRQLLRLRPGGLMGLREFLIDRYSQRGFVHLISQIEDYLKQ